MSLKLLMTDINIEENVGIYMEAQKDKICKLSLLMPLGRPFIIIIIAYCSINNGLSICNLDSEFIVSTFICLI